jgi:hypothetical protein
LNKKEDGKERKPIFPVTPIQAVYDAMTGASLEAILAQFNSIYVQYQGSPQATRNIIPEVMRRAGLTITYMDMESNTITERANSAVQKDNDHWGLDVNWSRLNESYNQSRGTTEERPNLSVDKTGYPFYDTTIKKPIWWDGEKWCDAVGEEV